MNLGEEMNTHDIELPPLPLTSFHARRPYETEFTPNYSVGHMRQYARRAIEADRQRRGEPVVADDSRSCAIADSNYAAGMLTGWNLCVADDEDSFTCIRSDRLRAAAQASRDAKEQDSAPQPASWWRDI